MILTCYFANIAYLPANVCPISICGKAPGWYKGAQYKVLAPKYWFFKKYKEDHDEEFYTEAFKREVLGNLKAHEVVAQLKEIAGDKIPCMLCYERPGDFCHRNLVAEWLREHGEEVKEFYVYR